MRTVQFGTCAAILSTIFFWYVSALVLGKKKGPEVKNYRKWAKVNPRPLKLPTPLNALCMPTKLRDQPQTSANPHRQYYFTVYVNKAGKQAMFEKGIDFPAGSVIVKEKLPSAESKSPELLTAMVKRKQGYFPEGGDWEYRVLNGSANKVIETGKLKHCASCHAERKDTGYAFRTYLPAKTSPAAAAYPQ